jgi:hypothetical protein
MYLFDKNGNEVKLGDWVYYNDEQNPRDTESLNRIAIICWVMDYKYLTLEDIKNKSLHKRPLREIKRVPETEWVLYLLERE